MTMLKINGTDRRFPAGIPKTLTELLEQLGIPCVLIVFFVPFVVGMLTGYNVAAVSTAFPALLALLTTGSLVLVAYCGAFIGVLVSPVHLCLILTRDYFGADLAKVYKTLIPMLLVVVIVLVGYSILLSVC